LYLHASDSTIAMSCTTRLATFHQGQDDAHGTRTFFFNVG
jgi:hypothetical protein